VILAVVVVKLSIAELAILVVKLSVVGLATLVVELSVVDLATLVVEASADSRSLASNPLPVEEPVNPVLEPLVVLSLCATFFPALPSLLVVSETLLWRRLQSSHEVIPHAMLVD
jgi:hypothetical protein